VVEVAGIESSTLGEPPLILHSQTPSK